ncbi:hypothetical protein D3C78_927980 [compost metagenome]
MHHGQRRAQVVGHRGEQGAAQLLGFRVQARRFQILRQLRAGQRLRQRLAEGRQQAPARGRHDAALFCAHAEQSQRPLSARQRQPPPAAIRQGVGAQAGRLVVAPGPLGGGTLAVDEGCRDACLDLQHSFSVAPQQAEVEIVPVGELLQGGSQHRLAFGDGAEPARQLEQRRGFRLGFAQGVHLPALARRQVAGQHRHHQEEQQGQDVFLVMDGQRECR